MRRILLRDIAGKAGVSLRTVQRVLNGEEHVNPSTRRHVSSVLSRYGYLLRQGTRREKLLIYGREGNPMIELLMKGILQDEYEVTRLSFSDSPSTFRKAVLEADIAVLFSNPSEADMAKIREWNPDVFRIVCSYGSVHDAEQTRSETSGEGGRSLRNRHYAASRHIPLPGSRSRRSVGTLFPPHAT